MTERADDEVAGELALQRRWAESRWPAPFLETGDGSWVRVISPGRWNRGPGPDFRGAQILDAEGRARRGDVELHLTADDWLQHGHADNPAYRDLLLHLVERPRARGAPLDARIPEATALPHAPPGLGPDDASDPPCANCAPEPPCVGIVDRAGAAAVEARLEQIARRRFLRKAAELRALAVPAGPGAERDRRAVIAAARALGQPHNADRAEGAAHRALATARSWKDVRPQIERAGWRRGRGTLGSPEGLGLVLITLVERWTAAGGAPREAFERLAALPPGGAVAELRIAKRLGAGRARQLLADAVYPLSESPSAWLAWRRLPGARYQRTDELRARLDDSARETGSRLGWGHPQTQALLELERTRCRQWACRICPLAAISRPTA